MNFLFHFLDYFLGAMLFAYAIILVAGMVAGRVRPEGDVHVSISFGLIAVVATLAAAGVRLMARLYGLD